MVEEHLNSYNSPYKFNAKEYDAETGNYYYGARYYNPKWSIWLSVDPMAEKYPSFSSYAYTLQNPIKYVDPDGNAPQDITIRSVKDKNGNISMHVTLTGKAIDLTGKVHMPSYIAALKSNLEKQFNGSHTNPGGQKINVVFQANITEAKTLSDIGENDHVFGIVDKLGNISSDGDVAGRAQLDGNITLIERSYSFRKNVDNHEAGHLLGLEHENGTFMHPNAVGNSKITNEQRQYLFNRYMNNENDSFRNSNKDNLGSGDSKRDFTNALRSWKSEYNHNELYKD